MFLSLCMRKLGIDTSVDKVYTHIGMHMSENFSENLPTCMFTFHVVYTRTIYYCSTVLATVYTYIHIFIYR